MCYCLGNVFGWAFQSRLDVCVFFQDNVRQIDRQTAMKSLSMMRMHFPIYIKRSFGSV